MLESMLVCDVREYAVLRCWRVCWSAMLESMLPVVLESMLPVMLDSMLACDVR